MAEPLELNRRASERSRDTPYLAFRLIGARNEAEQVVTNMLRERSGLPACWWRMIVDCLVYIGFAFRLGRCRPLERTQEREKGEEDPRRTAPSRVMSPQKALCVFVPGRGIARHMILHHLPHDCTPGHVLRPPQASSRPTAKLVLIRDHMMNGGYVGGGRGCEAQSHLGCCDSAGTRC